MLDSCLQGAHCEDGLAEFRIIEFEIEFELKFDQDLIQRFVTNTKNLVVLQIG